jgi:hypothetical protein
MVLFLNKIISKHTTKLPQYMYLEKRHDIVQLETTIAGQCIPSN